MWLLFNGFWNDNFFWNDNSLWNDGENINMLVKSQASYCGTQSLPGATLIMYNPVSDIAAAYALRHTS